MVTDELIRALSEYIECNYVQLNDASQEYHFDANIAKGKTSDPDGHKGVSLEQLVKEVGESFHEKLFREIDRSGMSDVEVYKRANIDRKLFSKIRSNPAYHPSKQTILALAIALELNINDTVDLLSRAEYALSPGSKGDLIVKYFIERGIYDIMTINFALDEYGQEILG